MTLNITVVSSWLIGQTSDFKLFRSNGNRRDYDDSSQKQVVIKYPSWAGLLCYTGVAEHDSHKTAEWLIEMLTHDDGRHRTPNGITKILAKEGSSWLRSVPRKYRYHTFTLTYFQKGVPHLQVISNFQRAAGRNIDEPLDRFIVSHFRPREPRCIVTGTEVYRVSPSVTKPIMTAEERAQLERAITDTSDLQRFRRRMAEASRGCASRAPRYISQNCVSSHLLPDGSGEMQLFGNMNEKYLPSLIVAGHDLSPSVPLALEQSGSQDLPHRLVGATWTADRTGMAAMVYAVRELRRQTGTGWE
ncbi:hypothetical protein FB388_3539 [Pseudonocardia cypriaca]|uniref:Uncharacterized protein n=1 Tax=Pseudonocardia cypriaca TaxID=882449 RepID=A0A543GJ77_9PSEU|nr:hypothetical protein FB388_3539 [Pseudonocardia cypriaca]